MYLENYWCLVWIGVGGLTAWHFRDCFCDITVYVIPENRKSNKDCVDQEKSGSPENMHA